MKVLPGWTSRVEVEQEQEQEQRVRFSTAVQVTD